KTCAVPGRRRQVELRGGSAHHRPREVERRGFENRIYYPLKWSLGDSHGNRKEQIENIRGSVHPEHAEELRDPFLRAGPAAARAGEDAASQQAPQERTRRRLLSCTEDRGARARRAASY